MLNQYDTNNPLHIKLSGIKENVKNVQKDLQVFFSTIKTKIFNDENADKRGKDCSFRFSVTELRGTVPRLRYVA
jgi:hypothetical protein